MKRKPTLEEKIKQLSKECGQYQDSEQGYECHLKDVQNAMSKLVKWMKLNKIN